MRCRLLTKVVPLPGGDHRLGAVLICGSGGQGGMTAATAEEIVDADVAFECERKDGAGGARREHGGRSEGGVLSTQDRRAARVSNGRISWADLYPMPPLAQPAEVTDAVGKTATEGGVHQHPQDQTENVHQKQNHLGPTRARKTFQIAGGEYFGPPASAWYYTFPATFFLHIFQRDAILSNECAHS